METSERFSIFAKITAAKITVAKFEAYYEIIRKRRPILSKERSQNVRYEIADNFLRFWFRYIAKNQNLVQMGLNEKLRDIVIADYPTYSGLTLEYWFREKLKETHLYENVGSWWNSSKGINVEQNEVDIVALPVDKGEKALIGEVKRQKKNFHPEAFEKKVKHLHDKILNSYTLEAKLFTLEDM